MPEKETVKGEGREAPVTLGEMQEVFLKEYQSLADEFDRHTWLMTLGRGLPGIPEEERREDMLLPGCLSRVWMELEEREGRIRLRLDSDTLIVRGILYLIWALFEGRTVGEAARTQITLLDQMDMGLVLNSARREGIGTLVRKIQDFSAARAGE